MVQVVESLSNKCEVLSSNFCTTQNKKKSVEFAILPSFNFSQNIFLLPGVNPTSFNDKVRIKMTQVRQVEVNI
jgi:hypothetical protein